MSVNLPSLVNLSYRLIDSSKYKSVNNVSNEKNIDSILNEYDYLKYCTGHVPSDITIEQMKDLLELKTEKQRKQYLRYLFLTEVRKLKDDYKRKKKQLEYRNFLENRPERSFGIWDEHGRLSYGLWANSILNRIGSKNVSHICTAKRLRLASTFGQKLVVDLDYDDHMSLSECRIQVRHIVNLLINNLRYSDDPFDIYFTNCNEKKPTMINLKKYHQTTPFNLMSLKSHFVSCSYLDIFPKERLVYLTPNANESLKEYNHDDIYIIGAFCDKSSLNKPISHLKASREGIRQFRLPIDENVLWASGSSKHLCIQHVVAILNQVKLNGGDWRQAFKDQILKEEKAREVVSN